MPRYQIIIMIYKESHTLGRSSVEVHLSHILTEMGYKNPIDNNFLLREIKKMTEEAVELCAPSYSFTIWEGEAANEQVHINTVVLNVGRIIGSSLYKADMFALFTATAGHRFQKWMDNYSYNNDILKQYIANCIGTIVVEKTTDQMQEAISSWSARHKLCHTNRYSPGYCGWNLKEQKKIFSLMNDYVCNISLTKCNMMYPVKSVSGIIGIGKNVNYTNYSCQKCRHMKCSRRKNNN